MPNWAMVARTTLGKVARVTGNSAFTRPAFVAGYEIIASLASRLLIQLPHAEAVYLTGSLLTPESVVPGVSDVDLQLVARLPTCETELEFRAALHKRWRRLSSVAPVLYNLEYFDRQDAPFLSAFGNSWIANLSNGFRLLHGTPLPHDEFERPASERACERLVYVLWKWRKTGCHLLDPRLKGEPWVLVRAAERMLALAVAHQLDVSRHGPLDGLLARSLSNQGSVASLGGTGRKRVRQCLIATLQALEGLAGECTAGWDGVWHVEANETGSEPSTASWRDARILSSRGFASVYLVPYGPCAHRHRIVAVGREGESADSVVLRAERAFVELEPVHGGNRFPERPLILTRKLWDAAALLEPSPFTGAHIASGRCSVLGNVLPPPKAPSREALTGILRARTTDLFYKPRGRLFRVGKRIAAERLLDDLRLAPALATALDTGVLVLGREESARLASADASEPAMVEALRGFIANRHEALRPELERRRRSRVG